MTKREIASLSFRLMGVYCLVESIFLLSRLAGLLQSLWFAHIPGGWGLPEGIASVAYVAFNAALPLALLLGLAWALIYRGDELSGWVFPEGEKPGGPSATTREVQSIAFSVVGLYLFATSISPLANFLALLAFGDRKWLGSDMGWYALKNSDQALQFLLGLFLFLRPRMFANAWHALRHYGHPDPAPPPGPPPVPPADASKP
ncbi:MAG: hypothetical protein AAB215_04535 [Planctomycetota bacterium]